MIKLTGTLFIRQIQGRNGAFSVGRLITEIGEFAVKDTLLDQYDQGRYEGEFGVSRIYPANYLAGGRLVVEVRATLATLALAAIDALPDDPPPVLPEPDPFEETVPAPEPSEAGDAELFGPLWPLGPTVRLDTTVDRARFRRQKDRLKALGYRFQPVGQTWHA